MNSISSTNLASCCFMKILLDLG